MVAMDARLSEHMVVSDAFGCWGCGATCGRECFQVQWAGLGCAQEYSIMAKEMLLIVVAAAVWGQKNGQAVWYWPGVTTCQWWPQWRRTPCI